MVVRVTGRDIARAAQRLVGVPWDHQGRDPLVGIDCVGVAVCAARACGLSVRDFRAYSMRPSETDLRARLADNCDEVRPGEEIKIGDVLAFSDVDARWPHHVGVYVGSGRMVHAYRSVRQVQECDLSESWRGKLVSVWRVRGLDD